MTGGLFRSSLQDMYKNMNMFMHVIIQRVLSGRHRIRRGRDTMGLCGIRSEGSQDEGHLYPGEPEEPEQLKLEGLGAHFTVRVWVRRPKSLLGG